MCGFQKYFYCNSRYKFRVTGHMRHIQIREIPLFVRDDRRGIRDDTERDDTERGRDQTDDLG